MGLTVKIMLIVLLEAFIFTRATVAQAPVPQTNVEEEEEEEKEQVYIVYADETKKPTPYLDLNHWYDNLSPKIVYKYKHALQGFAARLSAREAKVLKNTRGILQVTPQGFFSLDTTRTPEFLNLPINPVGPDAGENVIIGVLDSGIDPGSKSFVDDDMQPAPKRWKGGCSEAGPGFVCNNKLIGARFFSAAAAANVEKSARDDDGHGTHCASIAAGAQVPGANVVGYAPGTARGVATRAWLAVYKFCWLLPDYNTSCSDADAVAGIEAAIADGVDIISMSFSKRQKEYYNDPVPKATLAAVRNRIFVSASAGNTGPKFGTVSNTAPWMATVAAGTIDRDFPMYVSTGRFFKSKYHGSSFSGTSLKEAKPLVYISSSEKERLCTQLMGSKVSGKVVVCDVDDLDKEDRIAKGFVVAGAGGSGMVLANGPDTGDRTFPDYHVLPAVHVKYKDGEKLRKSSKKASLDCSRTKTDTEHAPASVGFSARGPNSVTPLILKPDMMAPGRNILAAYPSYLPLAGVKYPYDDRRSAFRLESGTSQACPHVSGVAAILKAKHPDWSPAAIRSALMTTGYATEKKSGKPMEDLGGPPGSLSTPYVHGSGYIDPAKAMDPGLVYDLSYNDYGDLLCSLGYPPIPDFVCPEKPKGVAKFNYPSFVALFQGQIAYTQVYKRTVTNVGDGASTYSFSASMPAGVRLIISPSILEFTETNEGLEYGVQFVRKTVDPDLDGEFGYLQWSDGVHNVRSPVAFVVTANSDTDLAVQ